jgi:hypothetical protein
MMLFHRSHKTRHLLIAIISILALLIFGLVWNWHFSKVRHLENRIKELEKSPISISTPEIPETHQTIPVDEQNISFTNDVYNFSFDYPSNLQVKNYNSTNLTIGNINESNGEEYIIGKTNLAIISESSSGDKKMDLEKFIFNKTKLLCDADGGGVSVSCPTQKELKKLSVTSALPTYALVLEREERTLGPEASTNKSEATFFVVDLSDTNDKVILVVYPVGDGSVALAKQISESVRR